MYIFRLGISAPIISRFGAFTSVQVNVNANGNNIAGDAANEPSISVDPTRSDLKMAIGWRQFDSVTNNFRKGGFGLYDGWRDDLDLPRPSLEAKTVFRSDPVLFSQPTTQGTFYYLSLIAGLSGRYLALSQRRPMTWVAPWPPLWEATNNGLRSTIPTAADAASNINSEARTPRITSEHGNSPVRLMAAFNWTEPDQHSPHAPQFGVPSM